MFNNIAANVAALQSSKKRQQETPQSPPPPPTTTQVSFLPPRPGPPIQQQSFPQYPQYPQQHFPQQPQQQFPQYPAQPLSPLPYNTHLLSHLVDPTNPSTISLNLTRTKPKGKAYKSAIVKTSTGGALYTIAYDPSSKYTGSVSRSTSLQSNSSSTSFQGHWKRHTHFSKKLDFFLPSAEGKWSFEPLKQRWSSDVSLLPGHKFQWIIVPHDAGYILKCVDTQTGRDICCIIVKSDSMETAVMEIPISIMTSWEQLDEVVAIALAVDEKVFTDFKNGEGATVQKKLEGFNEMLGAVNELVGDGDGGSSSHH